MPEIRDPRLASTALDVAYRASAELQTLDVRVRAVAATELPLAAWAIANLVQCIRRGLAGGAEFHAAAGFARLGAGPSGEGSPRPDDLGPEHVFRLEVAGVSPFFVRTIVEHLASAGGDAPLAFVSIVGGLPVDATPRSIHGGHVAAWLDEPLPRLGAYAPAPFRVIDRMAPRGASIRVGLREELTDARAAELEETLSTWQSAILTYPNRAATGPGFVDPDLTFARTRSALYARATLFDHAHGPARAALLGALAWYHERVAPIAQVEIALA